MKLLTLSFIIFFSSLQANAYFVEKDCSTKVLIEIEKLEDFSDLQRNLEFKGIIVDFSGEPINMGETHIYNGVACDDVDYVSIELDGLISIFPDSDPTPWPGMGAQN